MILSVCRRPRRAAAAANRAHAEAAGRGRRPALIDWHLERLAAAGCREAVINVAHLAEQVLAHVGDGARYGMRVALVARGRAARDRGRHRECAPCSATPRSCWSTPTSIANTPLRLKRVDCHLRAHRPGAQPRASPAGRLHPTRAGSATAPRRLHLRRVGVFAPRCGATGSQYAPLAALLRKRAGQRRLPRRWTTSAPPIAWPTQTSVVRAQACWHHDGPN